MSREINWTVIPVYGFGCKVGSTAKIQWHINLTIQYLVATTISFVSSEKIEEKCSVQTNVKFLFPLQVNKWVVINNITNYPEPTCGSQHTPLYTNTIVCNDYSKAWVSFLASVSAETFVQKCKFFRWRFLKNTESSFSTILCHHLSSN